MSDSQDITQVYHQNDIFSAMANKSIKNDKARLRSMVFAEISKAGAAGRTSDEVEAILNLPHQTISARITELKRDDKIILSGERRKTRSGRAAGVLVVRT